MSFFAAYIDSEGQWRWRLLGDNHRTLADSAEAFTNRVECLAAIRQMKREVAVAKVYDSSTTTSLLVRI